MRAGGLVEEAAAYPQPMRVITVRQVVPYPHDKHYENAQHECPRDEVMGVFGPDGPCRECVSTDQRHQETLAEDEVQAGDGEDDECRCRRPMDKTFQRVEAQDSDIRFAGLSANPASDEVEQSEQGQHAKDGYAPDPGQRALAKASVIPSLRLLQGRSLGVRDGDAALYLLEFIEKLLFAHR